MKYAFCFFPFIGIIIGIVIWLMGNLLINIRCNSLFFGCVMTVIPIFITGGIHFDGFLDTMDAINSYSDKEKKTCYSERLKFWSVCCNWRTCLFYFIYSFLE